MVALFITINTLDLVKHKLNLNEYLTLMKFQHDLDEKSFPFIPDERFYPRLIEDGFIEVKSTETLEDKTIYHCILGPAGIKVFKEDDDLFEEFYKTFPHKVPTEFGFRPVSTTDPNGMSARVTRGIWDKITKNKPYLKEKIITNLKKELANRQSNGSLGYLQNIDTWLRQATWEKWEDIPNKKNGTNYTQL